MQFAIRVGAGALLAAVFLPTTVFAGGAWLPGKGNGDVQIGFSRKQADTSWDANGDILNHTGRAQSHDFRYGYVSGEVGVTEPLSVHFLVTYLWGLEGPRDDQSKNVGFSDAWFGAKYRLRGGDWPMALAFTMRTDVFYAQEGPYTRDLYDVNGNFVVESPEWRGVLKEDYSLTYLVSRSLAGGQGWWNFETGYTRREGAPADQVPVSSDIGWRLPWKDITIKGSAVFIRSLGNDSPRRPDDRFGSRPGYSFNDASMGRLGVSFGIPLGSEKRWTLEAGYNEWVWGRSARRYEEPFLLVSRRF